MLKRKGAHEEESARPCVSSNEEKEEGEKNEVEHKTRDERERRDTCDFAHAPSRRECRHFKQSIGTKTGYVIARVPAVPRNTNKEKKECGRIGADPPGVRAARRETHIEKV